MSDDLHASTFEPHQGATFTIRLDGVDPIPLTLESVTELREQPGAPRPDPFALEFIGPEGAQFEQRIYPLEHEALGTLEVFLVPSQPKPDGLPRLRADFN